MLFCHEYFNMPRIGSKVAVVTEASVKYLCLSLIYDLKSFIFISLSAMLVGVANVAGQFDSTNSGTGSGGQWKLFFSVE